MIINVEIKDKKLIKKDNGIEKRFKAWNLSEADIEQFIIENPEILYGEEYQIKIIGRQVQNNNGKRSDILAFGEDGSLVLIEIKRDAEDDKARKEAIEFQSARYCAMLAQLNKDQIVEQYASYIAKYDSEIIKGGLTSKEVALREIDEWINEFECVDTINHSQKICLISGGFDKETVSGSAWLSKNGIDIRMIKLNPIENLGQKQIAIEVILPVIKEEDYFTNVKSSGLSTKTPKRVKSNSGVISLPTMKTLVKWKIVNPGDVFYIGGHVEKEAKLVDEKNVEYKGKVMNYMEWGRIVLNNPNAMFSIYRRAHYKGTTDSIDDRRKKYMIENGIPLTENFVDLD